MRTIEANTDGVFVITDARPPRKQDSSHLDDTELRRIAREAIRRAMNQQADQISQQAARQTSGSTDYRLRLMYSPLFGMPATTNAQYVRITTA